MSTSLSHHHPLHRLFQGLVENSFYVKLGWAEPALTDYLGGMLARFVHSDQIFFLRNASGRRLEEVAEMLVEAYLPGSLTAAQRRTAIHRHIGDFTLFWSGVYPEALARLRAPSHKDSLIDYVDQGKKSYRLAAEAERPAEPIEARVLDRIAERFEDCVSGLGQVRRGWESLPRSAPSRLV